MEMYRLINKQLSTHNQELRKSIQRFRYEVLYLNRRLLEQREEFNGWKALHGKTIEKSNLRAADTVEIGSRSPRAGSSSCAADSVQDTSRSPRAASSCSADSVQHRSRSPPACFSSYSGDSVEDRSCSPRAGSSSCSADSVKNRCSPRAGSSLCDTDIDESTFKMPSPGLLNVENSCLIESPQKLTKNKVKATRSNNKSKKEPVTKGKSKGGKQNKENHDTGTDSKLNFSDGELNAWTRRLRNKQVSLKEPSLRTKLRNTTNIKL